MLGLDNLFQTQGADLSGQLESPLSKIQRGPEQSGTGQDKRQDMNWTGGWTGDRTGTGQGHMARQDRNKKEGEKDCERTDHNPDTFHIIQYQYPQDV
jgi:hypothetical protein